GVFENGNVRGLVVVDGQVIAAIEGERGAIMAIQLSYGLAPFDTAWVARNRNDVLEDDVLGQQVEEVLTVHQLGYSFLNDPKERVAWKSASCPIAVIGPRPWPRLRYQRVRA